MRFVCRMDADVGKTELRWNLYSARGEGALFIWCGQESPDHTRHTTYASSQRTSESNRHIASTAPSAPSRNVTLLNSTSKV